MRRDGGQFQGAAISRGAEAREGQDFARDASNDAAGDATMSLFTSTEKLFASSILVGMTAAALAAQAVAQEKNAPPEFSSGKVGGGGVYSRGPPSQTPVPPVSPPCPGHPR